VRLPRLLFASGLAMTGHLGANEASLEYGVLQGRFSNRPYSASEVVENVTEVIGGFEGRDSGYRGR
jgi:hypothetical protein